MHSSSISAKKCVHTTNSVKSNRAHSSSRLNKILYDEKEIDELDNRIKQRFFTYSMMDMHSKYFAIQKRKVNKVKGKGNVYEDFKKRYTLFKEIAKPIIGTNEVILYYPKLKTSRKAKVSLGKEEVGYTVFPEGIRLVLIEGHKLFMMGRILVPGKPLTTALMFDINTNELTKMNDMIHPHCYHSIEFLENFDCVIVIGREKSNKCEMFNFLAKKWSKLPDLKHARSNVNIYFDIGTSDVYALFRLTGVIAQKTPFSDVIEVLELNDISSGWIQVDYYKSAIINLKSNLLNVFHIQWIHYLLEVQRIG